MKKFLLSDVNEFVGLNVLRIISSDYKKSPLSIKITQLTTFLLSVLTKETIKTSKFDVKAFFENFLS